MLQDHADPSPERFCYFCGTCLKGVRSFYTDCYEQGVLGTPNANRSAADLFFERLSLCDSEPEKLVSA